jgi:hypothetical protein
LGEVDGVGFLSRFRVRSSLPEANDKKAFCWCLPHAELPEVLSYSAWGAKLFLYDFTRPLVSGASTICNLDKIVQSRTEG